MLGGGYAVADDVGCMVVDEMGCTGWYMMGGVIDVWCWLVIVWVMGMVW